MPNSTVTPYLTNQNAAAAIEFYKKAFNAVEIFRMPAPDGLILHAQIEIALDALPKPQQQQQQQQ